MGSDADVGGASKAYWGLAPSGQAGIFWGSLSTAIPSGSKLSQSGYAGIRSREGPLVGFTKRQFDVTNHRFLELRVKANARRQWYLRCSYCISTRSLIIST